DADPVRIAQVLANLLNNAAKYSSEGSQIRLTAVREGSNAVVSVQDNGTGIPADLLPKIFDAFSQPAHTYNSHHGGLGIGLTLVRSLVEMHGGCVEARSEGPGQGSKFLLTLPLAGKPAQRDPGKKGDQPAGVGTHRILVVDDNRDAADS